MKTHITFNSYVLHVSLHSNNLLKIAPVMSASVIIFRVCHVNVVLKLLRLTDWMLHNSFITVFVTVFATVIAITKDLSDVEGDQANNISTFATRLGVRNVALLGELYLQRTMRHYLTAGGIVSKSVP